MKILAHALDGAFPGNTSRLATEIARLMRDGEKEKARELLQAAMDDRRTGTASDGSGGALSE